jgi:glucose/mannose transport system permease protein
MKPASFRIAPHLALLPMALVAIAGYLYAAFSTLRISLTDSRTFPHGHFIGLAQYQRLFDNERWMLSLHNLAVYGILFVLACLVIGVLLAIFIDQQVMGEGLLRTVFLYPYAMSFIATGVVWQWLLTPGDGIDGALRALGLDVHFGWIVSQDMAIHTIVIATVWQASGLVMAMVLAGLRSINRRSGRRRALTASRPGASTCRSCCRCCGRPWRRSCCCWRPPSPSCTTPWSP